MPVFQKPKETSGPNTCKTCKENTTNQPKDEAVECDICLDWICYTCSGVSRELYDLATDEESSIDYICKSCKETLPQIRELVSIKQKQNQLIELVKTEAQLNLNFRNQQETINNSYVQRLDALEKVVKDKNLADFPPLPEWTEQTKTIRKFALNQQKVAQSQQTLEKKIEAQESTFKEDKRRVDKESSLVVYGIPEKNEDEEGQMMDDFGTVKHIYSGKATLSTRDVTQVSRLGRKTDDGVKIRPIKLTFVNQEKRLEILRNNKNLILEGEEFPACSADFCDDKGSKHKHIYVSPDKTQQQRDDEKKLREELRTRKLTDPDLTIRNGKIMKKSTRARWADVSKD